MRAQWAADALKGTAAAGTTTAAEQTKPTEASGFEGMIAILGLLSVLFVRSIVRKQ